MTMNSSGPISLAGTTAGVSIEIENGGNGTTQISLNCAAVRSLAGVPSGAITMPTNFYGKANQFTYTISSNQTNFCMRAGAVSAGWNQSSALAVTIQGGVIISSNSTGTPAMTISGSYAGGVSVKNNGTIVGMGGNGGQGGNDPNPGRGFNGSAGGTALKISSSVTFCNASGVIAGGGGGGGGGVTLDIACGAGGGGGGGGRSSNAANSSGGAGRGAGASSGGSGTYASAGGGGNGGFHCFCGIGITGGTGGGGGGWGSNGSGGTPAFRNGSPYCAPYYQGGSGGSGGNATCGTSFVTWTATGTRYGSVS